MVSIDRRATPSIIVDAIKAMATGVSTVFHRPESPNNVGAKGRVA